MITMVLSRLLLRELHGDRDRDFSAASCCGSATSQIKTDPLRKNESESTAHLENLGLITGSSGGHDRSVSTCARDTLDYLDR
jgi:hypothetical protein